MANPRTTPVKPVKENVYTIFQIPFLLSAIAGVVPFSIPTYMKDKLFKSSMISSVWCLVLCTILAVNYHFATVQSMTQEETTKTSKLYKNRYFLVHFIVKKIWIDNYHT